MKCVNEWKHTAMTIPSVSVKSAQNTSEIQTAPTHFCICKKEEEQNLQWVWRHHFHGVCVQKESGRNERNTHPEDQRSLLLRWSETEMVVFCSSSLWRSERLLTALYTHTSSTSGQNASCFFPPLSVLLLSVLFVLHN